MSQENSKPIIFTSVAEMRNKDNPYRSKSIPGLDYSAIRRLSEALGVKEDLLENALKTARVVVTTTWDKIDILDDTPPSYDESGNWIGKDADGFQMSPDHRTLLPPDVIKAFSKN